LSRLWKEGGGFDDGSGHIDLPRAAAGGLAAGCFAVFTCGPPDHDADYFFRVDQRRALREALAQVALLLRLERAGGVRVVRSAADIAGDTDPTSSGSTGRLNAILHLEGAEPIGSSLDELEVFVAAGMRSLGLVWSRPNAYATGVPFEAPGSPDQGPGLTDRGRALIRACNSLGLVVDVSHLNARGFWDVAALSEAPLVASHCGAHALSPSPRNLTDDQLRAIGESGGIVGINFHVGFLRADCDDDPDTPVALIAEHAAHAAEVAGVGAVGLGSDFDGATMPAELGDVAGLPRVLSALRDAGFSEDDVEAIAWDNWVRVLRETWKT
jgi:membrane dipeptidase